MSAPALPSFKAFAADARSRGFDEVPHAERYGPERATCWVARRHPPPQPN